MSCGTPGSPSACPPSPLLPPCSGSPCAAGLFPKEPCTGATRVPHPPRPTLRKSFLPRACWPTSSTARLPAMRSGSSSHSPWCLYGGFTVGGAASAPLAPRATKGHWWRAPGRLALPQLSHCGHSTFEVIELSGLHWKGRARPQEGDVGSCLHFPNSLRSFSQNISSKAANPSLAHAKNARMPRPEHSDQMLTVPRPLSPPSITVLASWGVCSLLALCHVPRPLPSLPHGASVSCYRVERPPHHTLA